MLIALYPTGMEISGEWALQQPVRRTSCGMEEGRGKSQAGGVVLDWQDPGATNLAFSRATEYGYGVQMTEDRSPRTRTPYIPSSLGTEGP